MNIIFGKLQIDLYLMLCCWVSRSTKIKSTTVHIFFSLIPIGGCFVRLGYDELP